MEAWEGGRGWIGGMAEEDAGQKRGQISGAQHRGSRIAAELSSCTVGHFPYPAEGDETPLLKELPTVA